jgi:hypothetical protein
MPLSGYCTELKIGLTAGGLLELYNRDIEAPDAWTFTPYSVVRISGTGEQKSYGFPSASWSWEVLDQASLNRLLGFFDADTDASKQLFITTYKDVGGKQETADYQAYMRRPIDGEGKTLFPRSGGRVMQNVTIIFTHLEAA